MSSPRLATACCPMRGWNSRAADIGLPLQALAVTGRNRRVRFLTPDRY